MSQGNWLLDAAARTSRNRVILAIVIALGAVALLGYNATYLRAYFKGPTAITPESLERSPSLGAQPRWVKLDVAQLEDTGMTEVTVRTKRGVERGRSVSASYHAALLDSRALLVKVNSDQTASKSLVGELRSLEPGVTGELFKGPDGARMRELFLPVELHVYDFRADGHWILLVAAIALLGGGFYGWLGFGRWRAPDTHPVVRKTVRFGGADAVDAVLREERAEAQTIGGWTLGGRWLVRVSTLDVDVHPLDEMLWAYLEVTKKKYYYVIPAGTTHALVLKWRDASVKIEAKEDAVMDALRSIAAHQPWVVFGWNKEIQTLYERQRASFASQVAQGRKQWIAEQEAQQQAAKATVPAAAEGFAPTQPQGLAPA